MCRTILRLKSEKGRLGRFVASHLLEPFPVGTIGDFAEVVDQAGFAFGAQIAGMGGLAHHVSMGCPFDSLGSAAIF